MILAALLLTHCIALPAFIGGWQIVRVPPGGVYAAPGLVVRVSDWLHQAQWMVVWANNRERGSRSEWTNPKTLLSCASAADLGEGSG